MEYAKDNRVSQLPGSKIEQDRELSRELSYEEGSQYRAAAARCNFLAIDRPDIQFSSKEASKFMSSPRECDWDMIYKIARYLKGLPRLKHVFKTNGDIRFVDAHVDSDWAGDKISRKSTTGCAIKYGNHSPNIFA